MRDCGGRGYGWRRQRIRSWTDVVSGLLLLIDYSLGDRIADQGIMTFWGVRCGTIVRPPQPAKVLALLSGWDRTPLGWHIHAAFTDDGEFNTWSGLVLW